MGRLVGTLAIVGSVGEGDTVIVNARSSWGRDCQWPLPLEEVEAVVGPLSVGDQLILRIEITDLRRAQEPACRIVLAGREEG